MIKRALAATLCLMLVFALLPKTARAAENYTMDFSQTGEVVWNGKPVNYSTDDDNGTGWSWDASEKKLTLSGLNFETNAAIALKLPTGTTLVLSNSNAVRSSYDGDDVTRGISCDGALTVSGSGTLIATGGKSAKSYSYGVFASDSITVNASGGSISGTGGAAADQNSYGVYATLSITASSGSISGTGGTADDSSYGVATKRDLLEGGIFVDGDGTITGTGGAAGQGSYGVYTGNEISNKTGGGTITGTSGRVTVFNSFGVKAGEIRLKTGGMITGKGGDNAENSAGVTAYLIDNSYGTITGTSGVGRVKNYGVDSGQSLTTEGGSVTGTSLGNANHDDNFVTCGVCTNQLTIKNGGTVKGTSGQAIKFKNGNSYGVYASNTITMNSGAYLQGKSDSDEASYGIRAGIVTINPGATLLAQGHTQACRFNSYSCFTASNASASKNYEGSSTDAFSDFNAKNYKYIRSPKSVPAAQFSIAIAPQNSFPFGQAPDHATATVAPVNPSEVSFGFNASNGFGSATIDGSTIDLGSVGSPGAHGSVSDGQGSIVIHLNKAYLDTLTVGTHNLIVNLAGICTGKSAEKQITVQPAITFSTQPIDNTTVFEGSITGSLSAAASVLPSGTATLNWYACDASGTITGESLAAGGTFDIPTGLTAKTYYYLCQATFTGAEAVNSSMATVTVLAHTYTISVTPEAYDFGTKSKNYWFRPAKQEFTVQNTGNSPVTLSALTGSTKFEIVTPNDWTTELAPSGKRKFTVQPKGGLDTGTYDETFTVSTTQGTSDTFGAKFVVGTQMNVTITGNPSSLAIIEGQSVALTANITGGTAGAEYTYAWTIPATSTTPFATTNPVTVSPTANTTYQVEVTEVDNSRNTATATVTVTAATHGITVSPVTLSFGAVNDAYIQPVAQTVTVTYTGNIGSVTLTQPTSTDYIIGTLTTTVLDTTNTTATFTVQPKANLGTGTYNAPINIATTLTQTPTLTVTPSFTVVSIYDLLISPNAAFMQGNAPETKVTVGAGITGFGLGNFVSAEMGPQGGAFTLLTEGTDYDKAEGSIIITLHKSYLDTLMPGVYTLRINLNNQPGQSFPPYVETTIIVNAQGTGGDMGSTDVPKTGDAATPVLWLGLMLLAGAGLAVSAVRRKRRNG